MLDVLIAFTKTFTHNFLLFVNTFFISHYSCHPPIWLTSAHLLLWSFAIAQLIGCPSILALTDHIKPLIVEHSKVLFILLIIFFRPPWTDQAWIGKFLITIEKNFAKIGQCPELQYVIGQSYPSSPSCTFIFNSCKKNKNHIVEIVLSDML